VNQAAAFAATRPMLAGTRCTLRGLRPSDAPALRRHADDPAVAYNLFDGFPQPYTLADAEHWCGEGHRAPAMGHVWGIEVGGEVAGCISVTPQAGIWACSAVVGYWLGRAYWRRGITSEALELVTAWAWRTLPGITRLSMPIYGRNEASQGVARRAGYALEGRMPLAIRKAGHAIDAVSYGCLRPGLSPGDAVLPKLVP
jgi:ribosomal-protein-alanine N-acetyltransferase